MRAPKRIRLSKIILAAELVAATALFASSAKAGPLDAFAMVPPGNEQLQQQPAEPDRPAVELPDNLRRQVNLRSMGRRPIRAQLPRHRHTRHNLLK